MDGRRSSSAAPSFDERVLLAATWDRTEAWVIRQLIDSYGIPCAVICDASQHLFPVGVGGPMSFKVMVGRVDLESSQQLLAEHLREGMHVVAGGRPTP